MKTEHILLNEDPHSTWRTLPEKAPDLRQQDTPGHSVETRKGNQGWKFTPPSFIDTGVVEFSTDTQAYIRDHLKRRASGLVS